MFTGPSLSGDFDRDGRVDIALLLSNGSWLVLWNRLEERRFLHLRLKSVREASTSEEKPIRVELEAAGKRQVQLLSSDGVAHFGLGSCDRAERKVRFVPFIETAEPLGVIGKETLQLRRSQVRFDRDVAVALNLRA